MRTLKALLALALLAAPLAGCVDASGQPADPVSAYLSFVEEGLHEPDSGGTVDVTTIPTGPNSFTALTTAGQSFDVQRIHTGPGPSYTTIVTEH